MPVRDRVIQSQIKLSLFYKNGDFTVMVMHVKDLVRIATVYTSVNHVLANVIKFTCFGVVNY